MSLVGGEAFPLRPRFREPGVAATAWKLLRMRAVISWNQFKRSKLIKKIGIIFLYLLGAGFLASVVWLSMAVVRGLRSPQFAGFLGMNPDELIRSFPSLVFHGGALAILMTSFGAMLQALYLAGDMDFLLSTPVPIRGVFVAKLVQGILPSLLLFGLFAVPVMYGIGIAANYPFIYYPLVILAIIVLVLATAGGASLLVMVAARFVPAKRLAEVLGFVVGILAMVMGQSANLMNFADIEQDQVSRSLGFLTRFNLLWSPLTWIGDGLMKIGARDWLPGLGLTAAGLLVGAAVFVLALTGAEKLYYNGWSSMQSNRSGKKKKVQVAAAPEQVKTNLWERVVSLPVAAILRKDLILYRRDLRNVSRLVTPLIMGIIYAFMLLQGGGQMPEGQGQIPDVWKLLLETLFVYADVGLALFLGWMLAVNLGGLSFSMEGKNYWLLKTSPLGAKTLLSAKFLVAYLPTLMISSLYVLLLQVVRGFHLWHWLVVEMATAAVLAGLTGIYLAFGVLGAKFDWTNPNETGRTVGCLGTLAGAAFVPVCFVLFTGPIVLFAFLQQPIWIGQLIGLVLGVAAGALGLLLPMRAVMPRVPRLMES